MLAIVVNELGGAEVLTLAEHPDPVAGPGQVLVDVAAAGINFIDIYRRSGVYEQPVPYIPGSEGAGVVTAVGKGVTDFSVGDHVAWSGSPGSYAQKVAVSASDAVPVPEGIDLKIAAAAILQGLTAHYLCRSTYPVGEEITTVVHAAAGGVGLLLTQMIKLRGGTVIATTSSTPKATLAKQAGADYVTGYEDCAGVVREVTGGRGVDVVYDGVGKETFDASLSFLRPRGMLVLYGGSSGQVPPFDLQRLNSGGSLYVTRPTLAHYVANRAELEWRARDLFEWIAGGDLNVRIGGEYPLADAPIAHEDLAARRTTGKLILIP
jgi:NADPH2:quinone reductase